MNSKKNETDRAATVAKDTADARDAARYRAARACRYVNARTEEGFDELCDELIRLDPASATPKPEASAATQQAGRLSAAKAAMERAKKLPVWDSINHALHVELDVIFKALAAPISEDTGKPAAEAGGLPDMARMIELMLEAKTIAPNLTTIDPIALTPVQVAWIVGKIGNNSSAVNLPARTPASVGSISDDVGFPEVLGEFVQDMKDGKPFGSGWMALTRYIDRWAASRASQMEAAPRNAGVVPEVQHDAEQSNYCTRCGGEGVIHTGVEYYPTEECKLCEGTGNARRAPAAPDTRDALTDKKGGA